MCPRRSSTYAKTRREYCIDPDKLFVIGSSAGGYLAGAIGAMWHCDLQKLPPIWRVRREPSERCYPHTASYRRGRTYAASASTILLRRNTASKRYPLNGMLTKSAPRVHLALIPRRMRRSAKRAHPRRGICEGKGAVRASPLPDGQHGIGLGDPENIRARADGRMRLPRGCADFAQAAVGNNRRQPNSAELGDAAADTIRRGAP